MTKAKYPVKNTKHPTAIVSMFKDCFTAGKFALLKTVMHQKYGSAYFDAGLSLKAPAVCPLNQKSKGVSVYDL